MVLSAYLKVLITVACHFSNRCVCWSHRYTRREEREGTASRCGPTHQSRGYPHGRSIVFSDCCPFGLIDRFYHLDTSAVIAQERPPEDAASAGDLVPSVAEEEAFKRVFQILDSPPNVGGGILNIILPSPKPSPPFLVPTTRKLMD